VPAPAAAADRPDPAAGGESVVSSFETAASSIASEIAGRPVRVICNSAASWNALAAERGFEADRVLGFVLFSSFDGRNFTPLDYAQLSEHACRHADAFWLDGSPAPSAKTCSIGSRTEYRVEERAQSYLARVSKRILVRGKWVTRKIWVKKTKKVRVQVPVSVPVHAACPDYVSGRLLAIQTIAHESAHLAGVMDEAITDCLGMQLFAYTARRLGASADVARELAADYWSMYYTVYRPGTNYHSPECRDGGALDLAPDGPAWPDGFASDAATIAALREAAARYSR
jgi:hypothetical protein